VQVIEPSVEEMGITNLAGIGGMADCEIYKVKKLLEMESQSLGDKSM